jgi:hypothetical protein
MKIKLGSVVVVLSLIVPAIAGAQSQQVEDQQVGRNIFLPQTTVLSSCASSTPAEKSLPWSLGKPPVTSELSPPPRFTAYGCCCSGDDCGCGIAELACEAACPPQEPEKGDCEDACLHSGIRCAKDCCRSF